MFRVGRVASARLVGERFERDRSFDLVAFWDAWSAEFETGRPKTSVRVRASPQALRALPEVFGDGATRAIQAAGHEDDDGWRELTLTFEHEHAAIYRLVGFGDLIEVLAPRAVRRGIVATAQAAFRRHAARGDVL